MKKGMYFIATAIVLAVIALAAYIYISNKHKNSNLAGPVSSYPSSQTNTNKTIPEGESIEAIGTATCLSPKDTSGPQVASCAIGIKQEDGQSYALNSQDPVMTGSIPTGQKVKVKGTLSKDVSSQYNIVGVINVTTIERL